MLFFLALLCLSWR